MKKLLHIDTAGETGMVCISENGKLKQIIKSENQKEHASFIHEAIQQLLKINACDIQEINAIVVTEGPGSYTGLRVGLSSAKGLCFALQIPLITLNALELSAHASICKHAGDFIYCAMIDARRDEVFTATYDSSLAIIHPPKALKLSSEFLENEIHKKNIIFTGSGTKKLFNYISPDKINIDLNDSIENSHCILGFNKSEKKDIADIMYSEPLYIKEFYDIRS